MWYVTHDIVLSVLTPLFLVIVFSLTIATLLQGLVYFVWDEDGDKFGDSELVRSRYAEAQKALSSVFARVTGVLLVVGFVFRAGWAYDRGVSFAAMNLTEDLAFSSLTWAPTIGGMAVILIVFLFYTHDTAMNLVRRRKMPQSDLSKYMRAFADLRPIVAEAASLQDGSAKGWEYWRRLFVTNWQFFWNQILNLVVCALPVIVIVALTTGMLFVFAFPENLKSMPFDSTFLKVAAVYGLVLPVLILIILIGLYLPKYRLIAVIAPVGQIGALLWMLWFQSVQVVERAPQQLGGFRPERYIGTWKDGLETGALRAGYFQAHGDNRPDSIQQKNALPRTWPRELEINVVYKTEKYLFLAPMCVGKGKPPPNWKCVMLSTEGLESLQPLP